MVRNAVLVAYVAFYAITSSSFSQNLQEKHTTEQNPANYELINPKVFNDIRRGRAIDNYWEIRNALVESDNEKLLGSNLNLNDLELQADQIVLPMKANEYQAALGLTADIFPPSRSFLEEKDAIEQSDNFQMIKKMPKGGTLYSLLIASVPLSFMYGLTFQDNAYVRFESFTEFTFSSTDPGGDWESLSDLRETNQNIDPLIQSSLILPKPGQGNSPTFQNILFTYRSLTSYLPNFIETFNKALETFYEDNIMYAEIYYDFPEVYDLDGNIYSPSDVLDICKDLINNFLETHEDFIGARFIYCPIDSLTLENLEQFRIASTSLWMASPDFLLGFAVIVRGETEMPYSSLIEEFLNFPEDMKLFLDAGVTVNWGTGADFDIYDAIAFNTVAMGAAVTLTKHPTALDEVINTRLLIKSGPITTQVLGLSPDLREHPITFLVALDHPIIIAAVASTAWNATGLSYDFYEAYMAMTPVYCGLRCLKQFALNSLLYSNLPQEEKDMSIQLFEQKWCVFIDGIINESE